MYKILNLFIKDKTWHPLSPQDTIICDGNFGIVWNISWWADNPRQILISCESDLHKYSLKPWNLRENMVVSWDICQILQSGDVLCIWDHIRIRITYPCEPCRHLLDLEWFEVDSMQNFEHHRWILWYILVWWKINIWDSCHIENQKTLPLPIKIKARFSYICDMIPDWYIIDYTTMTMLMWVAPWYVRAMPKYIANHSWSTSKVAPKEIYISNPDRQRNYLWRLDNIW